MDYIIDGNITSFFSLDIKSLIKIAKYINKNSNKYKDLYIYLTDVCPGCDTTYEKLKIINIISTDIIIYRNEFNISWFNNLWLKKIGK